MNGFSDDLGNMTEGIEDSRKIAELFGLLASDLVGLAGLELRLFGHTLMAVIAFGAMTLLMLVGGWLFFAAALVVVLTGLQTFSVTGALLTVAALHLLLAGLMLWRAKQFFRDLTFPETRSSIVHLATKMKSPSGAAAQRSEGM